MISIFMREEVQDGGFLGGGEGRRERRGVERDDRGRKSQKGGLREGLMCY